MLNKKKPKITARGITVVRSLVKDRISKTKMDLENRLLERPCIVLDDEDNVKPVEIDFRLVQQADLKSEKVLNQDSMLGFYKTGVGHIILENPAALLRALTSIDVSDDDLQLPLEDLLAISEARLPGKIKKVLGRLGECTISDMSPNMIPMYITLNDPDVMPRCRAWAKMEDWLRILNQADIGNMESSDELCSSFSLLTPCKLGDIEITAKNWQSLRTGDVIFLDNSTFDAEGIGKVDFLGRDYRLQFQGLSDDAERTFKILD